MNGSKYRHDTLNSEPVAVEVRQEAMIGNGPGRCGLNAVSRFRRNFTVTLKRCIIVHKSRAILANQGGTAELTFLSSLFIGDGRFFL